MPEHCNAVFCLCLSSVAGQGIQNHTENLFKKYSFFLSIILSHILHSCLGLTEIYEYENKQKSSSWCYNTVKFPLKSILNFTCNVWFCPAAWMKLCSAVRRPILKINFGEHEELWSDCKAGWATDPCAPAPLSQVLLCAVSAAHRTPLH